mmetsp:Transcript_15159/g.38006  ORF Transcript_15159/g.38006 Transcript_15159/m.38006 type:complete len:438 (+) Transcript_15159:345-1658(+)
MGKAHGLDAGLPRIRRRAWGGRRLGHWVPQRNHGHGHVREPERLRLPLAGGLRLPDVLRAGLHVDLRRLHLLAPVGGGAAGPGGDCLEGPLPLLRRAVLQGILLRKGAVLLRHTDPPLPEPPQRRLLLGSDPLPHGHPQALPPPLGHQPHGQLQQHRRVALRPAGGDQGGHQQHPVRPRGGRLLHIPPRGQRGRPGARPPPRPEPPPRIDCDDRGEGYDHGGPPYDHPGGTPRHRPPASIHRRGVGGAANAGCHSIPGAQRGAEGSWEELLGVCHRPLHVGRLGEPKQDLGPRGAGIPPQRHQKRHGRKRHRDRHRHLIPQLEARRHHQRYHHRHRDWGGPDLGRDGPARRRLPPPLDTVPLRGRRPFILLHSDARVARHGGQRAAQEAHRQHAPEQGLAVPPQVARQAVCGGFPECHHLLLRYHRVHDHGGGAVPL